MMKNFILVVAILLIGATVKADGIQGKPDQSLWHEAKKAAKTMRKQGYVERGPLTAVRQYYNFYSTYNTEKHLFPDRYISAPTDNLAYVKATHNIKVSIASILGTYVEGVIRSRQDYNELSKNKQSQVDKIIAAAREKFASAIGDAVSIPVTLMKPRKNDDDNYSCYFLFLVDKDKVLVNSQNVMDGIKKDIMEGAGIDLEIDFKGEDLLNKVDELDNK